MTAKSVKIPETLHAELSKASADRMVGVAYLTEYLLRAGLAQLIPIDEIGLLRDPSATAAPASAPPSPKTKPKAD